LRGGAQHEVFPGYPAEPGQAGVDAGGVGGKHRTLGRRRRRHHLRGGAAEPVQPGLAVDLERRAAEQLGKLPRAAPAHEIHLEKPVLRVQEAQGAGHVGPG
jgi:hypothetical protein